MAPVRPEEYGVTFDDILQFKKHRLSAKNTTHKETWKAFERLCAKDFGTTRTPLSGMVKTITNSDTLHKKIYIECKLRGSPSEFTFWDFFEQERKSSSEKLVFSIGSQEKGDLVYFIHRVDFFKQMELTEFSVGGLKIIELGKANNSLLSLYNQTKVRAEIEEKIPVVAIKKKNKMGYLIGTSPNNFDELHKILKKEKND